METEAGAPMFKAVVVKKTVTSYEIELKVRYHRKSILGGKRKTFKVRIPFGATEYQQHRYKMAKQLNPGDELFVDGYGEEWTDPLYHNALQRQWNLKFA